MGSQGEEPASGQPADSPRRPRWGPPHWIPLAALPEFFPVSGKARADFCTQPTPQIFSPLTRSNVKLSDLIDLLPVPLDTPWPPTFSYHQHPGLHTALLVRLPPAWTVFQVAAVGLLPSPPQAMVSPAQPTVSSHSSRAAASFLMASPQHFSPSTVLTCPFSMSVTPPAPPPPHSLRGLTLKSGSVWAAAVRRR